MSDHDCTTDDDPCEKCGKWVWRIAANCWGTPVDQSFFRLRAITTILNTCLVIQHHGDEREARGRALERGLCLYALEEVRAERERAGDVRTMNQLEMVISDIYDRTGNVGAARKAEGSRE